MPASATPRLSSLPPPQKGKRGWPWTEEPPPQQPGEGDGWPTITVVTPSFNQALFVEATLRSVLLQGYPRLEYLVLDGGSTDGSVDVIRRYSPWLAGWTSEKDGGQSDALNKGFACATGDVVGWLNSDDRLLPGALRSLARQVVANPDRVAWAGMCRTVTPAGQLIYLQIPRGLTRDELADWGHAGQISQPACFFSRAALERVGGLERSYHYAMDFDLWLRLAAAGRLEKVDEVWAEETLHPDAKSFAQRGKSLAEVHLVQIRSGFEEIALRRMGEELQELETLKRGMWIERIKVRLNLLLRPLLGRPRY